MTGQPGFSENHYPIEKMRENIVHHKLETRMGFPVMPGKVPIMGHVHKISRNALEELRHAEAVCGPIFWNYVGSGMPVLQICGDEGLTILQNKFTDSSHLRAQVGVIMGEAMSGFDGVRHRRARGASSAAFVPKGLSRANVGETIVETVEQRLLQWVGQKKVAIYPQSKTIALDVILRIIGITARDIDVWRHYYDEFALGLIPLKINFPGFPAWRCRRARKWLEARVREIVEEVRRRDDRDCMVGAMLHGRDPEGNPMPETELIHNIVGLGFAGEDTTGSVMTWMMLRLAQNPDVWARLCAEVNHLDRVPLTFAELSQQAPYAAAVFRETLRMHPPSPFEMRYVHTEFEVLGHKIPPNILVGTSLLHTCRDARRYPDPDEWRPERWLDLQRAVTPVDTCAYGGGPHYCLGHHLATLEATLFGVLAARILSQKGIVPKIAGKMPPPVYLPFYRPDLKTFMDFSR